MKNPVSRAQILESIFLVGNEPMEVVTFTMRCPECKDFCCTISETCKSEMFPFENGQLDLHAAILALRSN